VIVFFFSDTENLKTKKFKTENFKKRKLNIMEILDRSKRHELGYIPHYPGSAFLRSFKKKIKVLIF